LLSPILEVIRNGTGVRLADHVVTQRKGGCGVDIAKIAIVTGSAGLVGAETTRFFCEKGFRVIGVDNDMRREFFGADASTAWQRRELEQTLPNYQHHDIDIRDRTGIDKLFRQHGEAIRIIVHAAAQPSHDWAAKDPITDLEVNCNGTMVLLESTRQHCPEARFVFMSTNKVYGDTPNSLPLVELETRWEVDSQHAYYERGIDESMSVDQAKHSLFGVSKLAADVMVQEYGRYFGMNTVCFRGGCLTGPGHSGAALHGFVSYLIRCALTETPYTILGYSGKQVRDNIHAGDLVNMFWHYYENPRPGEVYNAGGGRHSNCSVLEAIALAEEVVGKKMHVSYDEQHRSGDHIWYISDVSKFQSHYPGWNWSYSLREIFEQIAEGLSRRLETEKTE